jgi:hypothetical protein
MQPQKLYAMRDTATGKDVQLNDLFDYSDEEN